jgi:hypothetical protein
MSLDAIIGHLVLGTHDYKACNNTIAILEAFCNVIVKLRQ